MRIGIDVDDTITKTWETILPYYEKEYNINKSKLKNNDPYYAPIKDLMTIEEYYKFITPILEKEFYNIPIREYVKEALTKIKEKGNTIIIITARSNRDHKDALKETKDYLDHYQIPYDKIIVDAKDKSEICQKEQIDLFIDDSNKHCDAIAKKGIKTLMFTTDYNKDNQKHKHFSSWKEITEYICR